jgi:hypothetical protein
MNKTAKAAPEKVAGYCQDCCHYDRQAVARKEVGCKKRNIPVRRKNTCDYWTK